MKWICFGSEAKVEIGFSSIEEADAWMRSQASNVAWWSQWTFQRNCSSAVSDGTS
jgi:hypothetical protein